jgi:hypothetical protein
MVLNENHRSDYSFQDKTIADFVEIKKEAESLQSLRDNAEFAQAL